MPAVIERTNITQGETAGFSIWNPARKRMDEYSTAGAGQNNCIIEDAIKAELSVIVFIC